MNTSSYNLSDFISYLEQKKSEYIKYRKQGLEFVTKKIIELGKTLGDYPDIWKTKSDKVNGCTSNVYIHATIANNKIFYSGSSESEIVKGQIALLINGLNQLTPQEIVNETEKYLNEFVNNTELRFSMTISRANSLGTLYHFMKKKAQEFLNS